MQTKNNDKASNGDIGFIRKIAKNGDGETEVTISFGADRGGKLFRVPFCIDEQRVRVHRLVVADAGDVHAEAGEAAAGAQECADVIGERGDVGFAHHQTSSSIPS